MPKSKKRINHIDMPTREDGPPIGSWACDLNLQVGDVVDMVWRRGAPVYQEHRMEVTQGTGGLILQRQGGARWQWASIDLCEASYTVVARAKGVEGGKVDMSKTVEPRKFEASHMFVLEVDVVTADNAGRDVTDRMVLTAMREKLTELELSSEVVALTQTWSQD